MFPSKLFTFCILVRCLLVLILLIGYNKISILLSGIFLTIALSWTYIYLFDKRKIGFEVIGGVIWWNNLRPIHAINYFIAAYLVYYKSPYAFVPLFIDVLFGAFMFLNHYNE